MEALALTATQRILVLAASFFRKQLKEVADEKVQDLNTSQAWDIVAKQLGTAMDDIQASLDALRTADMLSALGHIETALPLAGKDPGKCLELMKMAYEAASLGLHKVPKIGDKVKAYGVYIFSGYQYLSNCGENPDAGITFVVQQWKNIGEDPLIMRELQNIISTGSLKWLSDSQVMLLREIYDLSLLCETFSNGVISRACFSDKGVLSRSKFVLFEKSLEVKKKSRTKLDAIKLQVQCRRCQTSFAPYEMLNEKSFCQVKFAKDDEERHHYSNIRDDDYYDRDDRIRRDYDSWECCDSKGQNAPGCVGPLHIQ